MEKDGCNNLKKYLDGKKCFKLICGAGNEDLDEIMKLCALYASAGCRFFDVNASVNAVRAAKEGIKKAGKTDECFICVSVAVKNDPHLQKFEINSNLCASCGRCQDVCLQKAIFLKDEKYFINKNKCIGCGKCNAVCKFGAIKKYSNELPFEKILPPVINEGIDCIEYHTVTDDEDDVAAGWMSITNLFKGALSVCLDRSKIGNEKIIERLKKMKEKSRLFMVQADGAPMSGGKDDFNTTLQAVAMADIIQKADITPYVIISGGTNSKTMTLARECGVETSGFAAGSYARKIVKEYIEKEDFLTNEEVFNKALAVAKDLVDKAQ